MGIGTWIAEAIGGSAGEIIGGVKDTIDEFHLSGEEKQVFELKMREVDLQFKKLSMEMEMSYTKDRQSARDMYMNDSSLQKIFAIVFLVSYVLISAGMIAMVISMAFYGTKVELPDWGVMLISSVFTAMSSKVSSITDFLFGGSKGKDDSDARSANAFKGSQG